ncbi:hypothetical protein ACFYSW_29160 [Rhodococcus aetherivorans]|uniref:AMP-binding enzyme n=1 Tax=Rhodococcus aetherivorans TaxID=191292 RepID=UPI0036B0B90C
MDEALVAHRAVEEAVTVVKKNAVGEAALVSYVISMPGYSIDTDDLIDFLSDRLPGRPLPESIVVADLLHHTSTATTSKARPSEREKTS